MILFSLALFVLAVLGAPLFSIIVTSAMIGLASEDTDLMSVAIDDFRKSSTQRNVREALTWLEEHPAQ